MEKTLSLIVPCYNSQDYLGRCLDSLLLDDAQIEIIIVNDGSTDNTSAIAATYAKQYPQIIKVINKKNGGHGDAINAGVVAARGSYVKIVDSDDWLSRQPYKRMLKFLKMTEQNNQLIDLVIANYVYDKEEKNHKKTMNYRSFIPANELISWNEFRFPLGKYLLMHSVIYRRGLLKEAGLKLPKNTFYVDNIYVFQPLPLVKKIYYLDLDLYHYFIGRDDQSVNEAIMINRIDQQLKVNKILVDEYSEQNITDEHVLKYMKKYVEIITVVSSILLIKEGSATSLAKKRALWQYIDNTDSQLYGKLRRSLLGIMINLPGRSGRKLAVEMYQLTQKRYGFN